MAKPTFHFQRFEFKYTLTRPQADNIIEDCLSHHLEWDPFVAGREGKSYAVTSLYLDTPALKCYHEKIAGLKDRFKIRVRIYDEEVKRDSDIFLEIKKKSDALVIKDRLLLDYNQYESTFENGRSFSRVPQGEGERKTAEEIIAKIRRFSLAAVAAVRYRRRPLIGRFVERLRITFDSELEAARASALKDLNFLPVSPRTVIMEVKYNNTLPFWLHRVIQAHNLDRQPFSKYGRGIETLSRLKQI